MPRHVDAIHAVGGKVLHIVNTTDGEEVWIPAIADPRVQIVVILTPNDLHARMAEAAAGNGKVVLCEKPLGITSRSVERLTVFNRRIFTVLQLRHHPEVIALREAVLAERGPFDVVMNISVSRDEAYFRSWKGDPKRSGGILFNIGIHYFDLLLVLFGEPDRVETTVLEERRAAGTLAGRNWSCKWSVSAHAESVFQGRTLNINGKDLNLSARDNLSEENLHRAVYQDLMVGKGVSPREALKSVSLVETICSAIHQPVPA